MKQHASSKVRRRNVCSDFLDLLKKMNREQADISNKGGVRSRKKPIKLDDYKFERLIAECSTSGKPPTKKAKKATTETPFDICINELDEDSNLLILKWKEMQF